MVLYGDASAADPYEGRMLGVFWNPVGDETHMGDGDQEPVTVQGTSGVTAPITVFQQVVLPELGSLVAWSEGDVNVGLYGRGWPLDEVGELVELADQLEVLDGAFRLPGDALPEGWAEVIAGHPSLMYLVINPHPEYWVSYRGESGILALHGLQMDEAEFEAFRCLTLGIEATELGGRRVLAGDAW